MWELSEGTRSSSPLLRTWKGYGMGGAKEASSETKGLTSAPFSRTDLLVPLYFCLPLIFCLSFLCLSLSFFCSLLFLISVFHGSHLPLFLAFLSDLSVAHLSCLFLISVSHSFLHLYVSLFSHSFSSLSASQSSFVLSFPQVFYFSFLLSFLSLFLTFTSFLIIFSFTLFFASYLPFSLPFIALCLPAFHPLPCAACEVKGSADEKDRDMSPFFPLVRPLAHTRFYPSFLYLHKLQVELRKLPPSEASASILQPVSHASSPWWSPPALSIGLLFTSVNVRLIVLQEPILSIMNMGIWGRQKDKVKTIQNLGINGMVSS